MAPGIEDYYSWVGANQLVHEWLVQHEVELTPSQPGAGPIASAVCSIQPAAFDRDGVVDDAIGIGRAQYFHWSAVGRWGTSRGWHGSLFIYLFHKDGDREVRTVLLDGDSVRLNRGDFELHRAYKDRGANEPLICNEGDNENIPVADFDGTRDGPEMRIRTWVRHLLGSCGDPRHIPGGTPHHIPEGFVCRAVIRNVLEVFGTATPPPHAAVGR